MFVHFFYFGYPVLIGQKCETLSIFPGWEKSAQILYPTEKCVICSNSSLFFILHGVVLSQQLFYNMFESNLMFIIHENQLREKYEK